MTTREARMLLDPQTSREALSKYPGGKQLEACNQACTIGAIALRVIETLERDSTLEHLYGDGFVFDCICTCANCALARPCGDDNSILCGTDNIIRGVDFYCSNAIRRKGDNDD